MNRMQILAVISALWGLGQWGCSSAPASQPIEPDNLVVDTPMQMVSLPESLPPTNVPPLKYPATVDELVGRFEPGKHEGFAPIERKYTTKSGIYMRKDAYEAFKAMHAAAKAEGVDLVIISATRNFSSQKGIWENKWTGQTLVDGKSLVQSHPDPQQRALKILNYSSMPGTSRHHWGTDIDMNSLTNTYFESGKGKVIYDWLVANAATYGFCQPYSPKGTNRPNGYNEEKWHWSYMPISSEYLVQYKESVTYDQITGFKGSETAKMIDVIPNYVVGIAPGCRDWK